LRILLIEDDADMASFILRGLRERGDIADHVSNGRDGLFLASEGSYQALIVDRLLPGMDGLRVVRLLRETGVATPALFLTALGGLDDRIAGFEAGGDDYLIKPFAFVELAARLTALARRAPSQAPEPLLEVADLKLDRMTRRVERAGQTIELQPREFRLLEYMMQHAGEIVTRTMLLEHVWDYHFEPKTSVVETHVSRLRAKIDKPFSFDLIKTHRGAGYVLAAPV